ncbi:MAG: cardiolipin synthase [Christensenellales bacterium]
MKTNNSNKNYRKVSHNPNISTVRIKTESNVLGSLKTLLVILLIIVQFTFLLLSYLHLFALFQWLTTISVIFSIIACIHVLSTNKNGQTKATWILFLLVCFMFGYIFYFLSDEHVLFWNSKRKFKKIYSATNKYIDQNDKTNVKKEIELDAEYLKNSGKFACYTNADLKYFPSGAKLFDNVIEDLKNAKKFIFMEFFIVSSGILLDRLLEVLEEKVKNGIDVRLIYDDMGSHGRLKFRTKKRIKKAGIKLVSFNRFLPVVSIALNIRDHRKIIVIDGNVGYTGGANLADEYINEKRMYGYWKDCGIRLGGECVNTLNLAFLRQWQYLTNEKIDYDKYFTKKKIGNTVDNNSLTIPYVDGLDYDKHIGRDTYINMIAKAKEKIYIMTPYFVPDDMIIDLLKTKALSGVDVRIILPDIADKKFVYYVTRDNVEKLIEYGVKMYTMTHSFVHSKVMLTECSAVIGSINLDQRSFYQQFESAVYTSDAKILEDVNKDFEDTILKSKETTLLNRKRRNLLIRIISGIFRIISVFM